MKFWVLLILWSSWSSRWWCIQSTSCCSEQHKQGSISHQPKVGVQEQLTCFAQSPGMGQLCYGSVIAYRCARKAYNHPIRNHFGFLPKGLVSPDKVESLFLCAWQHSVPTLPSIFQSWWPSTCQTTCLLFQKSISKCDCTDCSPQDFPIKASNDRFWGEKQGEEGIVILKPGIY